MKIPIILGFLLMIIRFFLGVKIISWLILQVISKVPHPISEIEVVLVFVIFDIWITKGVTEININKIED